MLALWFCRHLIVFIDDWSTTIIHCCFLTSRLSLVLLTTRTRHFPVRFRRKKYGLLLSRQRTSDKWSRLTNNDYLWSRHFEVLVLGLQVGRLYVLVGLLPCCSVSRCMVHWLLLVICYHNFCWWANMSHIVSRQRRDECEGEWVISLISFCSFILMFEYTDVLLAHVDYRATIVYCWGNVMDTYAHCSTVIVET